MKDYEERCQELLDTGDYGKYVDLVKVGLSQSEDVNLLAKVVGAIYEKEIVTGYWLIEIFVNNFPDSLHIIRVYLADLWAQQGSFDKASNEARIYLSMLKESGYIYSLGENSILQEGASRSFLLLSSIYTELGAKSYSNRILNYGLKFELGESWKESYMQELRRIKVELETVKSKGIDSKWEIFFNEGRGLPDIQKHCRGKGGGFINKRLELVADNYRFNANYLLDENEILMLVHRVGENEFHLG